MKQTNRLPAKRIPDDVLDSILSNPKLYPWVKNSVALSHSFENLAKALAPIILYLVLLRGLVLLLAAFGF